MKRRPVLAIGLDAADPVLLARWMESGVMPNLRAIRDSGVEGELRTPPALGDDATWASFSTGSSPAAHGRFFHRQSQKGTYSFRSFKDSDFGLEPFWTHLSRGGSKVAVVDVPKSPLARDLNGIQLADWLVHGRDGDTRSWPPELAGEILAAFGDDETDRLPEYLCSMETLPETQYPEFVRRLLKSVEKKVDAAEMLLTSDGWDLFLVVFKEAHCVGHQCWHLMDRSHPAHDEHLAEQLSQPMRRVYGALDDAVGRLVSQAPDDATIIVFSDLGMSANTTGEHLLESVLMRLEPLSWFSAWQRLHGFIKRFENPLLRRYAKGINRRMMPFRTAYHVEHNELSGAIRLNLRGREPRGRVAAEDGESVLDRLRKELLELKDPESHVPLVDEVIRAEGTEQDRFADLFAVWNRDAPFTGAFSRSVGTVRVKSPSWRTGNHVAGGVFFCSGDPIVPSRERVTASVVDLAPTIAALLGQELPQIEGRPIGALLKASPGTPAR